MAKRIISLAPNTSPPRELPSDIANVAMCGFNGVWGILDGIIALARNGDTEKVVRLAEAGLALAQDSHNLADCQREEAKKWETEVFGIEHGHSKLEAPHG